MEKAKMTKRVFAAAVLTSLVLTVSTLFVLPLAAQGIRRPLTPAQADAVAEKERARSSYMASLRANTEMVGGYRIAAEFAEPAGAIDGFPARLQQTAPLASPGDTPTAQFAAYETSDGPTVPLHAQFDPDANAPDNVSVFFGGQGSVWDVKWDIDHEFYAGGFTTPTWDNPDDGRWSTEDDLDDGSMCNPKYLEINQTQTLSKIELVSRNVYAQPRGDDPINTLLYLLNHCNLEATSITTDSQGLPTEVHFADDHRMHVRVWEGGWTVEDGYWSVGTPHWDNSDHSHSSYMEDVEAKVAEAFTDGNGNPLWFVQAIWTFPVPGTDINGRNSNSAGCLYQEPDFPTPTPCDGYAQYIQLAS
jgi:hypothetical protein